MSFQNSIFIDVSSIKSVRRKTKKMKTIYFRLKRFFFSLSHQDLDIVLIYSNQCGGNQRPLKFFCRSAFRSVDHQVCYADPKPTSTFSPMDKTNVIKINETFAGRIEISNSRPNIFLAPSS